MNKKTNQQIENERPVRPAFVFWLFIFLVLVALDQAAKLLAFRHPSMSAFGPGFSQQNFFNDRFAFSLPVPAVVMVAVYFLVLTGLAWFIALRGRLFNRLQALAFSLILAGGISNVTERAMLGGVRDFIAVSLVNWTGYYNLADLYILAGIIILLTLTMLPKRSLIDDR